VFWGGMSVFGMVRVFGVVQGSVVARESTFY
jgi:hypothetical protein